MNLVFFPYAKTCSYHFQSENKSLRTCSANNSTGCAGLNADVQSLEDQGQARPIPHLYILELNLQPV